MKLYSKIALNTIIALIAFVAGMKFEQNHNPDYNQVLDTVDNIESLKTRKNSDIINMDKNSGKAPIDSGIVNKVEENLSSDVKNSEASAEHLTENNSEPGSSEEDDILEEGDQEDEDQEEEEDAEEILENSVDQNENEEDVLDEEEEDETLEEVTGSSILNDNTETNNE